MRQRPTWTRARSAAARPSTHDTGTHDTGTHDTGTRDTGTRTQNTQPHVPGKPRGWAAGHTLTTGNGWQSRSSSCSRTFLRTPPGNCAIPQNLPAAHSERPRPRQPPAVPQMPEPC